MPNLLSNNSYSIVVPDDENIASAVAILQAGGLVAFPTETVYGLGADAENEAAVRAIYTTKGRPSHNPLIVHVKDRAMAEQYGVFTQSAELLGDLFAQGLTLVLPLRDECLAPSVLAGGNTVALRIPQHAVARALLSVYGSGIAAPSANRSGRISPTLAAHVDAEFKHNAGALRLILDGGACGIGLESTVVDCSGDEARLLRAGSISLQAMRQFLPDLAPYYVSKTNVILRSPGLLESHYAPNAKVRLNASHVVEGEALLAFGEIAFAHDSTLTLNLSPSGNVVDAAQHFYDYLRRLDALGISTIAVMPIPETGIGMAINDRLRRAASERG